MSLSVEKVLRKAQSHMKAGEWAEAEELYKQIIAKFPRNKKAIQGYQKIKLGITSIISTNAEPPQQHAENLRSLYRKGRMHEVVSLAKPLSALFPKSVSTHVILGEAYRCLDDNKAAIDSYRNALKLKPDYAEVYNNLGNALKDVGDLESAIDSFNRALLMKPKYADAYYNLGSALHDAGDLDGAIGSFQQALRLRPDFVYAYLNMGIAQNEKGELNAAISSYTRALKIKPDFAEAYNNRGNTLRDRAELDGAIDDYKKAIKINPDYTNAYWNLAGTASDISEARSWLLECLKVSKNFELAKLMIASLNYYEGDPKGFDCIAESSLRDHPFTRSFTWVFSLPELPKLYFNRWQLFDSITKRSISSRPFYEYGVWRAEAFKYLIKTFKIGYGFDTFEGLPEDWHTEKTGTYSSYGNTPEVAGGEFIVGKFEDTLPKFFSVPRPMASVINFDADLYSSTICALNYSKPVIDYQTILIFDEFLMNENWEVDEFKALEVFCNMNNFGYEVLAVSFFTKQVAVRLVEMDFFVLCLKKDIASRPRIKTYSYQGGGINIAESWLVKC